MTTGPSTGPTPCQGSLVGRIVTLSLPRHFVRAAKAPPSRQPHSLIPSTQSLAHLLLLAVPFSVYFRVIRHSALCAFAIGFWAPLDRHARSGANGNYGPPAHVFLFLGRTSLQAIISGTLVANQTNEQPKTVQAFLQYMVYGCCTDRDHQDRKFLDEVRQGRKSWMMQSLPTQNWARLRHRNEERGRFDPSWRVSVQRATSDIRPKRLYIHVQHIRL